METIGGSGLNIFRGKRCAHTRHRLGLCTGPLAGVCPPRQLRPLDRGSGQYLTSAEFWRWVIFSCKFRECKASGRQRARRSRRSAGSAVGRRDQRCMCLGGGGVRRMYLFLPASSKQIATWNSRAKASRGHGGGGRRVGRSTCPLLAAPAETGSSETVVSPALRAGNWSHRLAVSLVPLLFLGDREVAVFPKCRLSQAAGLLGSLSQADPAVLPTGKAQVFYISAFLFSYLEQGKTL